MCVDCFLGILTKWGDASRVHAVSNGSQKTMAAIRGSQLCLFFSFFKSDSCRFSAVCMLVCYMPVSNSSQKLMWVIRGSQFYLFSLFLSVVSCKITGSCRLLEVCILICHVSAINGFQMSIRPIQWFSTFSCFLIFKGLCIAKWPNHVNSWWCVCCLLYIRVLSYS